MRFLRLLSALVVVLPVGLTGCFRTTRAVQKLQAPEIYKTADVQTLEKRLTDRDAALHTLNARVLITASTGGAKEGQVTQYTSFRGFIFVQKPDHLRVILQLPLIGSRAMDMMSDGKTFTLLIPPRNKAIVGDNHVTRTSKNGLENLRPAVFLDALLVPGLGTGQYLSLTESTRVLQQESKHKEAIQEPDYDLAVLNAEPANSAGTVAESNILDLLRVVHISRVSMLPVQQDTYENGRIVTQTTYDKYQTFNGQQFPTLINIRRPIDEYSLKIVVTGLTLNSTFDADQFELKIPPDVAVQHME